MFPPFNGLSREDLLHSHQLRNHGLRVMGFVEKCAARLDQPDKLVTLCKDLGLRHRQYRVPFPYLVVSQLTVCFDNSSRGQEGSERWSEPKRDEGKQAYRQGTVSINITK